MLRGIDVSSNQPANICDLVEYDFAIVKASGNPPQYSWNYVNKYMRQQADAVLNRGKLLGLYHFTYGLEDPNREADHFCDTVAAYVGRAILVIDYEDKATGKGRDWVRRMCERVKARTGVIPFIYASSSVISEQDLGGLGYPIWSANYWRGYDRVNGYDTSGMKMGYAASKIWQFTSSGRLAGYSGNLDLDVAYMDASEWQGFAGSSGTSQPAPSAPAYSTGAYRLTADGLRVRTGAGTNYRVKAYSELTANAKANAYANGTLKRGTPVDVFEVATDASGNTWGRIPSGWIAMRWEGQPYVETR